jgi:cell division septation protein DedD
MMTIKKQIISLLLFSLIISSLVAVSTTQLGKAQSGYLWDSVIVDPLRNCGIGTSLSVDSSDLPHISYYGASGQTSDLRYANYNGSSWNIQILANASWVSQQLSTTSLVLDSNGFPHIAYIDEFKLHYCYWNGSRWSIMEADSTGGYYCSLVLGSGNTPQISHCVLNGDLRYTTYTNFGWKTTIVDSGGQYSSIALDHNNQPQISYYDSTNGVLKYASWNGSSWIIEVAYSSLGKVGMYSSLKVDSSGIPHIACVDYQNAVVKYVTRNASAWKAETVGETGPLNYQVSLALDSKNQPNIAYGNSKYNNLNLASRSGSIWAIRYIGGDWTWDTSLSFDSKDIPQIGCCIYRTGGSVLKYWSASLVASPTPTPTPTSTPTDTPTPTPTPTATPTTTPIATPINPTQSPTSNPTANPTTSPTQQPTTNPTTNPTTLPTQNPTLAPTPTPTAPELQAILLLPIFALILFGVVAVKLKKQANMKKS